MKSLFVSAFALAFSFSLGAIRPASADEGLLFDCLVVGDDLSNNPLDEGLSAGDSSYKYVHANTDLSGAQLGAHSLEVRGGDTIRVLKKNAKVLQVLLMKKDWGQDEYVVTVNLDRKTKDKKRVWGMVSYKEAGSRAAHRPIVRLICK